MYYDMTDVKKRYFPVKLKNGKKIDLNPPKLKVFRAITALTKTSDKYNNEEIDNLVKAISLALSSNRQNYTVTTKQIEDWLDYDEIYDLLTKYFTWVQGTISQKN